MEEANLLGSHCSAGNAWGCTISQHKNETAKTLVEAESPRTTIESLYRERTPTSAALHKEAQAVLPGGDTRAVTFFQPHPLFIAEGYRCFIKDVDGNEYIDFVNNYTSLIHGHAYPAVVKAVGLQLTKGTTYAAPVSLQIELARALCGRISSVEQVRFCNSGTEATMFAIRLAKAFTGRDKILKMEGGYHGSHDAVDISVEPPLASNASFAGIAESPGLFRGTVSDVLVAPFNDVETTSEVIERYSNDLAAVIIEPIMGAAGMVCGSREYLHFLREATRSHGILLIFDEVVTFRIGYSGAQGIHDLTPDLTALGKIIGGGFPIGAFGGRSDVMSLCDPRVGKVGHSGTFNGNAISMIAGCATLNSFDRNAIAYVNDLGVQLRTGLQTVLSRKFGSRATVTGFGSLINVHFIAEPIVNYRDTARADRILMEDLHLALLNRGIFAAPRGMFCTSTAMQPEHVNQTITAFEAALNDVLRGRST